MGMRPFSNGTEYRYWAYRNCDHCKKGANVCLGLDEWPTCPIEAALAEGYIGDGAIPDEIYERMGDGMYCEEQDYIDPFTENSGVKDGSL